MKSGNCGPSLIQAVRTLLHRHRGLVVWTQGYTAELEKAGVSGINSTGRSPISQALPVQGWAWLRGEAVCCSLLMMGLHEQANARPHWWHQWCWHHHPLLMQRGSAARALTVPGAGAGGEGSGCVESFERAVDERAAGTKSYWQQSLPYMPFTLCGSNISLYHFLLWPGKIHQLPVLRTYVLRRKI